MRMTARLRLTLTFAGAFALLGATLLVISYALVSASLKSLPTDPGAWVKLAIGVPADQGPALNLPFGDVITSVRDALAARALHRLTLEYLVVFVALLAIATLAGWWMAGRALAPVRAITGTARRVSRERLGERIALDGPDDELHELAGTLNDMLDRLQSGFASQERFIANASHELRTPLAVIRTEVDVTLADPDAGAEELRAMGEVVREAADRSERLIEALLVLARSDGGRPPGDEPVDLAAHVRARLGAVHRLAVDLDGLPAACVARGEPQLLLRVVDNLLDNAINYNLDDGWIAVSARADRDGRVVLTVANAGAPIDPRDAAHLTEPFRRLGTARTGADGVGLGLSIVEAIMRLHGGRLHLQAPRAGGLVAEVELPGTPPSTKVDGDVTTGPWSASPAASTL